MVNDLSKWHWKGSSGLVTEFWTWICRILPVWIWRDNQSILNVNILTETQEGRGMHLPTIWPACLVNKYTSLAQFLPDGISTGITGAGSLALVVHVCTHVCFCVCMCTHAWPQWKRHVYQGTCFKKLEWCSKEKISFKKTPVPEPRWRRR